MFFKRNKKRSAPRMGSRTTGILIIDNDRYQFTTHDLSLSGASLEIEEKCKPKKGIQVELLLDDMEVSATATLRWIKSGDNGGTVLGIEFDDLEGHEEDIRYKGYSKEQ